MGYGWLGVCLLMGVTAHAQMVPWQMQYTGGIKPLAPDSPEAVDASNTALDLYNQQGKDLYTYCLKKVIATKLQVVAGLKYYLETEVFRCFEDEKFVQRDNAQTFVCKFDLLVVPWLSINRLLKGSCGEPIVVVGPIMPISPKDPLVQNIALYSVNQFNIHPSSVYVYGMVQVLAAKKQVVSGIKFYLDVWMAECVKETIRESASCTSFVSAQEYACYFVVLVKPGELGGVEFVETSCIPFGISQGGAPRSVSK